MWSAANSCTAERMAASSCSENGSTVRATPRQAADKNIMMIHKARVSMPALVLELQPQQAAETVVSMASR